MPACMVRHTAAAAVELAHHDVDVMLCKARFACHIANIPYAKPLCPACLPGTRAPWPAIISVPCNFFICCTIGASPCMLGYDSANFGVQVKRFAWSVGLPCAMHTCILCGCVEAQRANTLIYHSTGQRESRCCCGDANECCRKLPQDNCAKVQCSHLQ